MYFLSNYSLTILIKPLRSIRMSNVSICLLYRIIHNFFNNFIKTVFTVEKVAVLLHCGHGMNIFTYM